jgi:hypothetical protein
MFSRNQSFKSEEDIISKIPNLFLNQKEECKIVYIDLIDGMLTSTREQNFISFNDLEKYSWDINYSQRYIALIKDVKSNIITFRGIEKVVSYKKVNGDIILDFFKDRTQKNHVAPLSQLEKKGLLKELKNFFSR